MVFSSAVFLFAFLPVFLGVYYLLPFRYRSAWILAASLTFYGFWRVDFLFLMVATTVWSHLLCRAIYHARAVSPRRARQALTLGVLLNIGTLAYFKYFNFGVESLNSLIAALGGREITAWEVILPIGISFYVFQATSYLIDVYRGQAGPAANYLDVAAYITLFPQLVAGPIVRWGHIAPQLTARTHTPARFAEGTRRFMLGFAKKVLIADGVASLADAAFALSAPHAADAWLGIAAYAVQIYYDFSGYSDMAVGLGLMIGFRFPENFDRPYLSRSITEFWRRWHMSLSGWLRDYLYIPLGGNRRGTARTYANLLTVMVIGGLWHGAAWTFVLWGAWHGVWLIGERLVKRGAGPRPVPGAASAPPPGAAPGKGRALGLSLLGLVYTMAVVLTGWVLFRAPDLQTAGLIAGSMVGLYGTGLSTAMAWQVKGFELTALAAGAVFVYLAPGLEYLARREPAGQVPAGQVPASQPAAGQVSAGQPAAILRHHARAVGLAVVFLAGVVKLLAESHSPFLYFQF
ncbi:MAG: MBOAT family O-acyltransferase [Spirochaetota bacterium]